MRQAKRFNVLKNGRRWGKTQLAIWLATETMRSKYPVGYWCPTYKDLFEVWREMKDMLKDITTFKNETVNQIEILGGGKIDFWSMQDPDSGRGRKYKRAIIDEAEKADKFKECFDLTIRPTLVDLEGDAWILSTPKGRRTYFHELFERKNKFNNWMSWQKGTKENPYIPQSEIDEARAQLDTFTYLQEFEGESIDHSAHPWAHAFSEVKHVGTCEMNIEEPLYISFDFNHDPITCTVWQHYRESIICLQEYYSSKGLEDICLQIRDAVGCENNELVRQVFVTGDMSGWAKSAIIEGNKTCYDVIMKELLLTKYQCQAPKANPNLTKSRQLTNSLFAKHPDLIIHKRCEKLIYDLKFVESDDKNQIVKDRSKEQGKADFLDSLRYYLNTYHQEFVRL